jgi:hypothetical protein
MFVVLVLMSVMLMGALAMARMTEVSTLAAGNAVLRNGSLHTTEAGINAALTALTELPDTQLNSPVGNWYWPNEQPRDALGAPRVDWNAAPQLTVGNFSVRYVVERICSTASPTDPLKECLVRAFDVPSSARDIDDRLDSPSVGQYRATVQVQGPRGASATVQVLMTRG